MTIARESSKGLQRRAQILAVARQLLVEEGYDRFVLREIAARTGMKLGNLQYYFRTREVLLEAVTRAESADDLQLLEAILGNGHPGEAQLRELTRTLLRKWSGDGGKVYAVALFLAQSQSVFRTTQREMYQQFYEHLILVLKNLQPKAHRSTLLDRARLISALLDGALLQLLSGALPSARARDRFVDDVRAQAVAIATQ